MVLAGEVPTGGVRMGNTLAGADSTGCVRLKMNDAGRITDVDISALWRTRLGPKRLAAAVMEALGRAAGELIRAVERFEPIRPSRHTQTQVADAGLRTHIDDVAQGRSSVAMHRLADLMDEVLAEVSHHLEQARSASERDYVGTDGRKHVKVMMLATGVISAVEIDEQWLASVSTERLTQALRDAIQTGYDRIERSSDLRSRPVVQMLRALRNDPTALWRWLREE
jgi:DNA-binding protein YbaB